MENEMKCERCGTAMLVDDWHGWVWKCFHCGSTGRPATNDEVMEGYKAVSVEMQKAMTAGYYEEEEEARELRQEIEAWNSKNKMFCCLCDSWYCKSPNNHK